MEYYAIVKSGSFEHHGILGQKHGVRRAEWYPIDKYKEHLQNMGYSERTIKKKMRKAEKGEKKYQKQLAKNRAKSLAKANIARKENLEAKKRAEEFQKEKDKIVEKGDIDSALKRLDDFSNEELAAIKRRYDAKNSISKAKTDQIISKMGTIADATNKAMNIANNSIGIYNGIAKIANTFGDTNLPILGQNQNNKKTTTTVDKTTNKKTVTSDDESGNRKITIDYINNANQNNQNVNKKNNKSSSDDMLNNFVNNAAKGFTEKVVNEGVKAMEKDGNLNGKNNTEKFVNGGVREFVKAATSQGTGQNKVNEMKNRINNMSSGGSTNDRLSKYYSMSGNIANQFKSGNINESEYRELIDVLKKQMKF